MVVLGKKRLRSRDEDEMEEDEGLNTVEDASESEDEDDDDDDIKLTEPSKTAIYNRDGLLDKLSDISWPKNVDWLQSLSLDIDQPQEVDVNDDLAREAAFYTQALEGTRQAFEKLQSRGLPFLRPFDYYAEMVKSDIHMGKVRGKLLYEKKQIEEAEERRKSRDSKRISKQVQAEKQKERAKDKKEQIESVKKWRKQREKSGFANDKEELPFDEAKPFSRKIKLQHGVSKDDRSGGKARQFGGKLSRKKGRDFKNSKFGYGGRKGMKKQNTSDTTSDLKGFNNNSNAGNKKQKRF